jgi:hypothetical protein
MTSEELDKLRTELSVKSKNGINFTLAASIVWLIIAYVWMLNFDSYNKSVFVFIVGPLLLPLAFLFSKLLKTSWTIEGNPLQPLGLWLNFAQLFYFPFLVLALIIIPDYFVVVYAIITGAHFFPYAWFYKTNWYAVFAGIISVGVLLLGLFLPNNKMFLVAVFTSIMLFVLTAGLYIDSKKKTVNQLSCFII